MAHLHSVYDTDNHFSINPITRAIRNEATEKTSLVQYDHDSERFTFELPRYVEGHDMSLCDKIEVHFINIGKDGKSEDVYPVTDSQISPEDDNVVIFSWLISGNATKYAGSLNFLIRFVCLNGTEIEYAWNTAIYSGITIADGINNGEAVITEYADVLEKWKRDVFADMDAEIKRKTEEALATIPEDYATMDAMVKASASKIDRNDKRITNLEKGITPEPYETDASVAFVKDVPEDALPFAEVNMIGGMTYKDGDVLRSAPTEAVESVGANLIPFPYVDGNATRAGVTFTVDEDGKITINGTATEIINFVLVEDGASFLPPNANISLSLKNGTGSVYLVTGGAGSALPLSYSNNYSATVQSDGVLGYCLIQIPAGTVVSNLTVYPMINKGTTAQPYAPYVKHTLPIPEAVQALDGYGEGVNESVYNYIDYEKKQFVKRVGYGTIQFVVEETIYYNNVKYFAMPKPTDFIGYNSISDSFIFPKFKNMVYDSGWDDSAHIGEVLGCAHYTNIWFGFPVGTTLAEAQAVLLGLPFVYELATPEVTDISDILPDDNYIGVEGGGTLTFKNQYEFDVPSEVTYALKGAES